MENSDDNSDATVKGDNDKIQDPDYSLNEFFDEDWFEQGDSENRVPEQKDTETRSKLESEALETQNLNKEDNLDDFFKDEWPSTSNNQSLSIPKSVNCNTISCQNMSYSEICLEVETNWALSSHPLVADKIEIEGTVIDIINDQATGAFEHLLDTDYELTVLNDKKQTALHLIFYEKAWTLLHILNVKFSDDHPETRNCTNLKDRDGLTHLHVACVGGSLALVERFLKNDADVNDYYNGDSSSVCQGFTPLHFAVINPKVCKKEIIMKLIERGANVHAVDFKGRTPLHIASMIYEMSKDIKSIKMINIEVMDILMKYQSNIKARDVDGNTPLLSIFPSSYEDFRFRRSSSNPHSRDEFYHVSKYMMETKKKLQFLLERNVDLTASNNKNQNILHLILVNLKMYRVSFEYAHYIFDDSDHIELIRQILSTCPKIEVNMKTQNGETPLQMAVACMSPKIVEMFLNHGTGLSSLTFETNKKRATFFCYPDMVLIFEPLHDLLNVLDLLSSKDFILSLNDKIQVLTFLLHEGNSCDCHKENDFDNIKLALQYGDEEHNEVILDRLHEDVESYFNRCSDRDSYDSDDSNISNYSEQRIDNIYPLYLDLIKYLYTTEFANIYSNESVKLKIRNVIDVLSDYFDETFNEKNIVEIDLNLLKCTKYDNNVNLHDILIKDPKYTSRFIANDFDPKSVESLIYYKDVVKGHITRARVRFLFENYSTDYFKILCESLPEVCCCMIASYLDNKDILNLGLAVMVVIQKSM